MRLTWTLKLNEFFSVASFHVDIGTKVALEKNSLMVNMNQSFDWSNLFIIEDQNKSREIIENFDRFHIEFLLQFLFVDEDVTVYQRIDSIGVRITKSLY